MRVLFSNPDKRSEFRSECQGSAKVFEGKGWTLLDLSQRMGIAYNTLHLVMKGKCRPGNLFIAGLLNTCTDRTFEQFFTVTDEKRQREGQAAQKLWGYLMLTTFFFPEVADILFQGLRPIGF